MNVNDIKEKVANFNYSLACADGRETDCMSEDYSPQLLQQVADAVYADVDDSCEASYFFIHDHNTREYVEFHCDILDEAVYREQQDCD